MIFPQGIWIVIAVSFLLCCMGFYRFVWFMSVGYGLSSAGIGVTLFIMALIRGEASPIFLIECLLMLVYGIRLGGFLLIRELKNENYRKKLQEVGGDTKVPVFVGAFMWLYCGFVYVMQASGPVYRCLNGLGGQPNVAAYIGTVIAAAGILIEGLADKQKSAEKDINPNLPAMNGLYKMCRCPNYFGEMLFWTGLFISGIGSYSGAQWIVGIFGLAEIIVIMVSGAKRVETRHIKHYGKLPEYNAYADHTPLLLPLIPWYHMTSPEKIAQEEAAKKARKEAKAKK